LIDFRIRRSEHITPELISLHWLRVPERISFKLAVLTHRSIHGTSPSYLQSCFTRVSDITSRQRLPHIVWTFRRFVSWESAGGRFRFRVPPSGTTCRRICAVTRGFQTTTEDLSVFPFLPRHYHM